MKQLYLILSTLLTGLIYSQDIQWAKSESYAGNVVYTNCVAHDKNGNTIVAGKINQGVGIYILKYDANGNNIWTHTYEGFNVIAGLITDTIGNAYALMFGSNLTINDSTYVHRPIIVKYDPQGNILWIKDNGPKVGILSIASNGGKGYYANGSFRDTIYLENNVVLKDETGKGKYFLAYFNFDGECQWALSDEGSLEAKVYCSNNNTFLVSCYFTNTVTVGQGLSQVTLNDQNSSYYQAEYSNSGSLLWVKQVQASLTAPDRFGNVFFLEYNDSASYISKYNSDGNLLWKRTKIDKNFSYKCQMTTDRNGNLFFSAGFLNSVTIGDTIVYGNSNSYQFALIKMDSAGTVRWIKTSAGSGGAGAKAISVDDNNNIYITGDMQSNVSFDNFTLSEPGGGIFTLKIKDLDALSTVGLSEIKTENRDKINIHPNPTNDYIVITGAEIKTADIKITNVLGQYIYSRNCKPQGELREQIVMSHYPKGIYLIEVSTEKGKEVRKVVLE